LASSSFGESSGCSGVLKDLVLIDSVLFECENKPVLTPSEILQCKEIVNCLIESGFVSQNTLPEGGVVPGATTEKCVQQPTKCSDEE
jgi:hypothetical protein